MLSQLVQLLIASISLNKSGTQEYSGVSFNEVSFLTLFVETNMRLGRIKSWT